MKRAFILELLGSLLPYVEHAERDGLPNAAHHAELLRKLLWRAR